MSHSLFRLKVNTYVLSQSIYLSVPRLFAVFPCILQCLLVKILIAKETNSQSWHLMEKNLVFVFFFLFFFDCTPASHPLKSHHLPSCLSPGPPGWWSHLELLPRIPVYSERTIIFPLLQAQMLRLPLIFPHTFPVTSM